MLRELVTRCCPRVFGASRPVVFEYYVHNRHKRRVLRATVGRHGELTEPAWVLFEQGFCRARGRVQPTRSVCVGSSLGGGPETGDSREYVDICVYATEDDRVHVWVPRGCARAGNHAVMVACRRCCHASQLSTSLAASACTTTTTTSRQCVCSTLHTHSHSVHALTRTRTCMIALPCLLRTYTYICGRRIHVLVLPR